MLSRNSWSHSIIIATNGLEPRCITTKLSCKGLSFAEQKLLSQVTPSVEAFIHERDHKPVCEVEPEWLISHETTYPPLVSCSGGYAVTCRMLDSPLIPKAHLEIEPEYYT